jgi:hypothetical protein
MVGVSKRKSSQAAPSKKKAGARKAPNKLEAQLRAGMPAIDSVYEKVDFVSPQKVKYKILKTTETDAYDKPLPPRKKKS